MLPSVSSKRIIDDDVALASASAVKRSKIVQARGCNGSSSSVDENTPQNMQEDSGQPSESRTLIDDAVTKSRNDLIDKKKKPAQKCRLNLKKGKAELAHCSKDKSKTKLCQANKLVKNSSFLIDEACIWKEVHDDHEGEVEEAKLPTSLIVQNCPVCKNDVSKMESDIEVNEHINKCLDHEKDAIIISSKDTLIDADQKEICQICEKDLSRYNTIQRQQHINRCCDFIEESCNHKLKTQKQLMCLICGKVCKTLKSRQSHMKRCAKVNNVSTVRLVELNQNENVENQTGDIMNNGLTCRIKAKDAKTVKRTLDDFEYSKRKQKKFQNKNMDEETQIALALSASLQSGEETKENWQKSGKRKNTGKTELPALLLRSDNESKKVTEARAAAVLCQWADSDEEIQCTPALAPSSLLLKYGGESETHSVDAVDQGQISDQLQLENGGKGVSVTSEDVDARFSCQDTKGDDALLDELVLRQTCESREISLAVDVAKISGSENNLTVDTQTRLWRAASLSTGNLVDMSFYVPNLLPKTTPRKRKFNPLHEISKAPEECCVSKNDQQNVSQDSPIEDTTQSNKITESQEKDIEELAELVSEDESEGMLSNNEKDKENSWYHSSGFCVRRDTRRRENQKGKENVSTLLDDLSCMVGNPLYSDVEIMAKDNQQFFAHSFMLATRCSTLAKMLRKEESCRRENNSKSFITLEMVDIDVRAIHAVVTFIYTASFLPVNRLVMENVKRLVDRLDLNCDVDEWEKINEETERNEEIPSVQDEKKFDGTSSGQEESLDVLLKSLWEGEDVTKSFPEEEDNAFGDSVLHDELGDMEIKIYTQVTPNKNRRSLVGRSCEKLNEHLNCEQDLDSDKSMVVRTTVANVLDSLSETKGTSASFVLDVELAHDNDEHGIIDDDESLQSLSPVVSRAKEALESNVLEIEDGNISGNSDDWFVPETPRKQGSNLTSLLRPEKSRPECDFEQPVVKDDILHDWTTSGESKVYWKGREETQRPVDKTVSSRVLSFAVSGGGDLKTDVNIEAPFCQLENSPSVNRSLREDCSDPNNLPSPSSPMEIILSPGSPEPAFFYDHNNCGTDTESGAAMKGTILQCSDSGNPELTTEKSTSLNEIDNTKNPVNKNSNNDNWLEESISSSFSRNAVDCEINAEENLYGGDCYDDQEIDCYDDGGFNCDIGDYFNVDTSDEFDTDVRQTGTETEQKEADNIALHTENVSNSARHDQVNVEKRGRECKTVGNKRRQTKPQKSMTPMLDYSNMATPDLTTELKQYGVRPLAKRKMIMKLKEIYHYTHQDSSSDSEMEDKNDEKQAAAEGEQLSNGEWEKPRTCSKNSEDCSSAQDSGESSESGSCSVGDELSEDILSQESSLNLSKRIMDLLTQNRQLYLTILKYQPISLLSVQEILKDNGVKCSAEKLKDFLDEQCITFSEPRPAQARRKQRRAKPKSRKKN